MSKKELEEKVVSLGLKGEGGVPIYKLKKGDLLALLEKKKSSP